MLKRIFADVRASEAQRFQFFFTLALLLLASQAIAMTVCESLLLSRLGIQALPYSVLAGSALTMVCSILYSRYVGRSRHEDYLLKLLGIAIALILLSVPAVLAQFKLAYVAVFAFHFATFTVFTTHLQTLSTDYFDTLAAKRIMPLVGVGATLGEIIGGLSSSALTKLVPVEWLLLGWALFLALAALYTVKKKEQLRIWNPSAQQRSGETSTREAGPSGLKMVWEGSLSRSLLGMVCSMALTMAMVQYVVSDVLVRSFPDEAGLAWFLGVFVAVSNTLELVLASQFTPWILRRIGVAKANAIHSVGALLTLLVLWNHYALVAAVLAWMNRKTVRDALAAPVLRLVYNAVPLQKRARVMAFVDGVAGSGARVLASLFLTVAQGALAAKSFILFGLGFGVFYLFFVWRVGRQYLATLVSELGRDRLGFWDGKEVEYSDLPVLWEEELKNPVVSEVEGLAERLSRAGYEELLLKGLAHHESIVRAACVSNLGKKCPPFALQDTEAAVRLKAVRALWRSPELLGGLTDDSDPSVRSLATAACGKLEKLESAEQLPYLHQSLLGLAENALDSEDPKLKIGALARLSGESCLPLDSVYRTAMKSENLGVAAAAVRCLSGWDDPLAIVLQAQCLAHTNARIRHIAAAALSGRGGCILPHVQAWFRDDREAVAESAYQSLAGLTDTKSRVVLGQELRLLVRRAWRNLALRQQVHKTGALPFLSLALQDRARRCERLAFRVLTLLEGEAVVGKVVGALQFSDAAKRASALEVLSHLGDREAAALLVLLTEPTSVEERLELARRASPELRSLPTERDQILELCRQSPGRYVTLGAKQNLSWEQEQLVKTLLFLHRIELFSSLSLEQLEQLSHGLVEERFQAGEEVQTKGRICAKLYLLMEGTLSENRSIVGEVSTLDEGSSLETVTALHNSRLWSLHSSELKALIRRQPSVALPFIRRLAQRLKEQDRRVVSS